MRDSESILEHFFKYNKMRIPVYQRNYDWKRDNCKQLLDDLKNNAKKLDKNRKHFFGSIIYIVDQDTEARSIIDGQQRIITTALLLSAIRDLLKTGEITSDDPKLEAKIDRKLVDQDDGTVFIRPVKKDIPAYDAIVRCKPEDYDERSNLYINYEFFKNEIKKLSQNITIDDLYESMNRLHVMVIRLNSQEDDAQMVFESINSTGLNLSEGDKIRNFLLMNLDSKEQTHLYDDYWTKIESNVGDLSRFFRDYITAVSESIPNLNRVYQSFKEYANELRDDGLSTEEFFLSLLKYSKIYNSISQHDLDCISSKASKTMYRINYMESTVSYPFLMRILDAYECGKMTKSDVEEVLCVLENYLIRRSVCGKPTNALNKVFQTLYKSLEKLDISDKPVDKLRFIILNKEGSSSYPSDSEVKNTLAHMNIYNNHKLCPCILSILEGGNKDSGNILARIDSPDLDDRLTIEHVMPQKKTEEWRSEIGDDFDDIHQEWVHRLGNLTLTAYNSEYGCRSYSEKLNMEPGGLKFSPLNLNQFIKGKDRWTKDVIEERNNKLVEEFIRSMPALKTDFIPENAFEKGLREYALDEGVDFFASLDMKGYFLFGQQHSCRDGVTAFVEAMCELYNYDPEKIIEAEKIKKKGSLGPWLCTEVPDDDRDHKMIGPGMYVFKNISHKTKASLLMRAAEIQGIDLADIGFIGYKDERYDV